MSVYDLVDRDMNLQEAEWMIAGSKEQPKRPVMKELTIGATETRGIVWTGAETRIRPFLTQTVYFFPIAPLSIPEWEFVGPTEWEVLFLGMRGDLPKSWLTDSSRGPESRDDDQVAVIRALPHLIGMDKTPMCLRAFIISVVLRAMDGGQLIRPDPYLVIGDTDSPRFSTT